MSVILTGQVDYGTDLLVGMPTGSWAMKGRDGKIYNQASGSAIGLANANDNSLGPSLSDADISADILAGTGLVGYASEGVLCVPGTEYVGMIRGNFAGDVYGAFYFINESGALELEGVFHYLSGTSPLGGFGDYGHVAACVQVHGEVYFLLNAESTESGTQRAVLAHVPYTGTNIAAVAGSWDLRSTQTGFSWGPLGGGRRYWNWATLKVLDADTGSMGVFVYRGAAEGGPDMRYQIVTVSGHFAQPIETKTGFFPEVIDDVQKLYDGSPGGTDWDDFTAPTIYQDKIVFLRPFSDNPTFARGYIYQSGSIINPGSLDTIVFVGTFEAGPFDNPNSQMESVRVWVDPDDSQAYGVVIDRGAIYFFMGPVLDDCPPVEECASSGVELTYPPCKTNWTDCVRIVRRDDLSFHFTTLDRDFDFRGNTYLSCNSITRSATQSIGELGDVGNTELLGLLHSTGIDDADLYGGLFDDAFVEVWRVPYEGGDVPRRLAAGWVGKVSQSARGYKMEVLGPGARLDQRPIVQVVTPGCRWVFGDSHCGIDVDSLGSDGVVTSGLNRGIFLGSIAQEPIGTGTGQVASSGALSPQYADGKILWLTGRNAGQVTETKSVEFETAGATITLWAQTAHVPEAGDTFRLFPGCAQDFPTCRDIYDNVRRFGGFPYVPGQDAILKSPNAKAT